MMTLNMLQSNNDSTHICQQQLSFSFSGEVWIVMNWVIPFSSLVLLWEFWELPEFCSRSSDWKYLLCLYLHCTVCLVLIPTDRTDPFVIRQVCVWTASFFEGVLKNHASESPLGNNGIEWRITRRMHFLTERLYCQRDCPGDCYFYLHISPFRTILLQ